MSAHKKVALVTGASSGIGRATAEAFLRRGYATVLADRDVAAGHKVLEQFKPLGDAIFVSCDVCNDHSVKDMINQAVAAFGRVDAAFNAAGVDGEQLPTADASEANWDRIMSVNLKGLWFCLRREIRQMVKQGGGAIVNCASSAGLVGVPNLSAYVASKHGVVGLTKSAALEYIRSNIRINAVCPGMIDTPMWQRSISPDATAKLLANDPIGRMGLPSEIAEAAVWLCDPAASFVTGHAMAVDGGMTVP